jgi:hypothetical protein
MTGHPILKEVLRVKVASISTVLQTKQMQTGETNILYLERPGSIGS